MVFSASGSFSQARTDLYKRALKAFFKLRSNFGDLSPNIDTSLHIFDHTVKPILLYGSEIWGLCTPSSRALKNVTDFKLEKAYSKYECDKLTTKFYKYVLGVHKRATNLAVYGELGRTPYFIDIICGVIKYYKRIQNMDSDSFLAQSLKISEELYKDGKES